MQTAFKVGLFHSEPTVLKRRLLPLCLGHVYTLMAVESPLASNEAVTVKDLVLAVGIFSRSFEDGLAWINAPESVKECAAWGRSCRRLDFRAETRRLQAYLGEYLEMPERYGKGKATGHPWPLAVAVSIMPLVGESRAWNMPLPRAMSYWSALGEINGDNSIKSDADYELAARARREYAERNAG